MRLFELRGISKNFGAIQALTGVDLKIDAGEVLGLMGDNGAGKSTLIKIMAGNFPPSAGEIWLKGEKVEFHNPVDARKKGVEVVYQDLALCDNLTAAENVFLGREATRKIGPFNFIHYAAMFREAARRNPGQVPRPDGVRTDRWLPAVYSRRKPRRGSTV